MQYFSSFISFHSSFYDSIHLGGSFSVGFFFVGFNGHTLSLICKLNQDYTEIAFLVAFNSILLFDSAELRPEILSTDAWSIKSVLFMAVISLSWRTACLKSSHWRWLMEKSTWEKWQNDKLGIASVDVNVCPIMILQTSLTLRHANSFSLESLRVNIFVFYIFFCFFYWVYGVIFRTSLYLHCVSQPSHLRILSYTLASGQWTNNLLATN